MVGVQKCIPKLASQRVESGCIFFKVPPGKKKETKNTDAKNKKQKNDSFHLCLLTSLNGVLGPEVVFCFGVGVVSLELRQQYWYLMQVWVCLNIGIRTPSMAGSLLVSLQ